MTTPHLVYVERAGKLYRTAVEFKDDAHLLRIIEKDRIEDLAPQLFQTARD